MATQALSILVMSFFFAMDNENAFTRKYESLAWFYLYLGIIFYTLYFFEFTAWLIIQLGNSADSEIKLFAPTSSRPLLTIIFVSVLLLGFLLRCVFFVTH